MSIHNLQLSSIWKGFTKRSTFCAPRGNPTLEHAAPQPVPRNQRLSIQCAVRFRPCIDIHKGKVKQIVGSTLQDSKEGDSSLITNYESDKSAAEYAKMYKDDDLIGGHIIMLGADPLSKAAALEALHAYPDAYIPVVSWRSLYTFLGISSPLNLNNGKTHLTPVANHISSLVSEGTFALRYLYYCTYCDDGKHLGGLQIGGGINSSNALTYIDEGASHVIVTSYVFRDGQVDFKRLEELARAVGKQRLVLDLSCRKKDDRYAVVTDRWQKFSDVYLDQQVLDFLAKYADEFLVHGVDVEGKKLGIDEELVALLGRHSLIPVTYAGGVTIMADLERIKLAGTGRVDVTVGSALDIFGGNLPYKDVVSWHSQQKALSV